MTELPKLSVAPSAITHSNEALRLVLYGDPGVGKTTLAMTFPRPLVLNADGGLVAVTAVDPTADLGVKVEVTSYNDLTALFFYARDHIEEWDTFVLDGIDELAFVLTDELILQDNEYEKRKRGSGYNPRPSSEFIPEQPEYLANQRQLHTFLTYMRRLNKHIVVTVGVREADPPKIKKRTFNMAPGAAGDLKRWASVIGELVIAEDDKGNEVHALVTKNGDSNRESKTRFAALAPAVVEPTFDKLWSAIAPEKKTNKGAK